MKNSIVTLFLLLLSQLGYGQGRTFKGHCPSVGERTEKIFHGRSMIPVPLLNWMVLKLLIKCM